MKFVQEDSLDENCLRIAMILDKLLEEGRIEIVVCDCCDNRAKLTSVGATKDKLRLVVEVDNED